MILKDKLNANVHFASTTNTATIKLKKYDFNCVISDLMLPPDNPSRPDVNEGAKFLKGLRDGTIGEIIGKPDVRSLPLLICSGYYDEELLSFLSNERYADVIFEPKPIMIDNLVEWIHAQIQSGNPD